MSVIEFLKQIEFLNPLSNEEFQILSQKLVEKKFASGQIIVESDTKG